MLSNRPGGGPLRAGALGAAARNEVHVGLRPTWRVATGRHDERNEPTLAITVCQIACQFVYWLGVAHAQRMTLALVIDPDQQSIIALDRRPRDSAPV